MEAQVAPPPDPSPLDSSEFLLRRRDLPSVGADAVKALQSPEPVAPTAAGSSALATEPPLSSPESDTWLRYRSLLQYARHRGATEALLDGFMEVLEELLLVPKGEEEFRFIATWFRGAPATARRQLQARQDPSGDTTTAAGRTPVSMQPIYPQPPCPNTDAIARRNTDAFSRELFPGTPAELAGTRGNQTKVRRPDQYRNPPSSTAWIDRRSTLTATATQPNGISPSRRPTAREIYLSSMQPAWAPEDRATPREVLLGNFRPSPHASLSELRRGIARLTGLANIELLDLDLRGRVGFVTLHPGAVRRFTSAVARGALHVPDQRPPESQPFVLPDFDPTSELLLSPTEIRTLTRPARRHQALKKHEARLRALLARVNTRAIPGHVQEIWRTTLETRLHQAVSHLETPDRAAPDETQSHESSPQPYDTPMDEAPSPTHEEGLGTQPDDAASPAAPASDQPSTEAIPTSGVHHGPEDRTAAPTNTRNPFQALADDDRMPGDTPEEESMDYQSSDDAPRTKRRGERQSSPACATADDPPALGERARRPSPPPKQPRLTTASASLPMEEGPAQ